MKILLRILIVCVIALILLGALLVLSASGTYSAIRFNNIYHLFQSHLWKVVAAFALMIIFSLIPYDYYKNYSKPLLFWMVWILLLTYVVAPEVKGAARWLNLGLFKFQPSDLAKILLIIHLANLIERKGETIKSFKRGLLYPLVWVFLVAGLVLIQPNISTAIIMVITSFILLYVGGAKFKHISFISIFGAAACFGAMMLFSHSRERIFTYINNLSSGGILNIQVNQAKIALGTGGWAGIGLGHSRQSDLFLPESYGDFIFSVLGEELGFIGAIAVLFAFLLIFLIGLVIALKANDKYGQLLAFGISINIIVGAFINASVVMGLVPTTGITLPFISFGGTSIILFAISIGILLNIAFQYQKRREIGYAQA